MVVKPAERILLFHGPGPGQFLPLEAGVPAGVLEHRHNGSSTEPAVGNELSSNPLVRKLSFTGSTEPWVPSCSCAMCADNVKKAVSLELGGNAPR